MIREVAENIYTFPINLPHNPLKVLNSYVIKAAPGGKNLLIDVGFNCPRCRGDLKKGVAAMGLSPENTDVFFTHGHADHTGNASWLQNQGYNMLIGATDHKHIFRATDSAHLERMSREGVPPEETDAMRYRSREEWMVSDDFTARDLEDGETLSYGGYKLRCVLTPGHSLGHMCLYDEDKQLMFTGDHVLFDITPNINVAPEGLDSLGSYMQSLEKVANIPVKTALPGHRQIGGDFAQRVRELYQHHMDRLQEAEDVVRAHPGISAYGTAQHMTWSIVAKSWDDFPIDQKWYAYGEALSHLVYLEKLGRVRRVDMGRDTARYFVK